MAICNLGLLRHNGSQQEMTLIMVEQLGKGKELGSSFTPCGKGSRGSLLFEVLVKECLDLEHRVRAFFNPFISGGEAKRAEKWCGGIGFRGLKMLEITAAWV